MNSSKSGLKSWDTRQQGGTVTHKYRRKTDNWKTPEAILYFKNPLKLKEERSEENIIFALKRGNQGTLSSSTKFPNKCEMSESKAIFLPVEKNSESFSADLIGVAPEGARRGCRREYFIN